MAPDPDPERDAANHNEQGPPNLVKFRDMTGIDTPATLQSYKGHKRPAKNLGVYSRVVSEERKAGYTYYLMSTIINISFLGQIIVAAAITALSAANSSHMAITILGSVNTVIAGVQTYLKGQGLPNRIKQYQFGLRKLREYIEDRERDFSHEDCKLNVDHVISEVSAMYQAVRQTAEDNTPDNYLPMEGAGKKLLGQKDQRTTPLDELAAKEANPDGTAIASKEPEGGESKGAEDAKPADDEAGSSSADKGPQSKSNDDEDNENTPLLKPGQS